MHVFSQHPADFFALLAGSSKRHSRIYAKGNTGFFTAETITKIPVFCAAGFDKDIQPTGIDDFVGFIEGF
ncbi:hypothetical protein AXR39_19865 [Salmonella enterica subsp. enterica serovar Agona]|uniref:Uncharacterized protein n=1 Tax=Salmonella enterica subsp. enterica serovar Agona TaxID=58095 RepID=A0A635D0T0_SALET|nr:hypothetical protein [Salmonella enterica subsp. enterica serovar Agona]EDH9169031.1 hypothetical protein [Salmonella enterica subsp. enterica serovar Fallowfield]EDJ0242933.1 hypothetical protein [Salmonella enterica]EDH5314678.1 hypothetical protein [Salmonella enterica subsp. enterica serovar Agona]EDH5494059.1 hypothetical protein [Salmonella enterica subsp. enterica serovar Agona]